MMTARQVKVSATPVVPISVITKDHSDRVISGVEEIHLLRSVQRK